MAETKIEWTSTVVDGVSHPGYTFNPWRGCEKIAPECANCLSPDTVVLLSSGAWVPIGSVRIGDRLVAFDECGPGMLGKNRLIREAIVENKWSTESKAIRFRTESGKTIVCSHNHKWLVKLLASGRTRWVEARDFNLSTAIITCGDPSKSVALSEEYLRGYLAGATAGDGTMRVAGSGRNGTKQSYWRIAVAKDDSAILERVGMCLESMGLDSNIKPFDGGGSLASNPKPMVKLEHRSQSALSLISECINECDSLDWKKGWLAGFLDTDGTAGRAKGSTSVVHRWTQSQGRNNYLEKTVEYLGDIGFRCVLEKFSRKHSVRLVVDSTDERIQFVTSVRPALERKGLEKLAGRRFVGSLDRVVSLEECSSQTLVDVTTSTRTFVANGLATHNCYAERQSKQNPAVLGTWGVMGSRVVAAEDYWSMPLKWNEKAASLGVRLKVFCASFADVFEDWRGVMVDHKGGRLRVSPCDAWVSAGPAGAETDMQRMTDDFRDLMMSDVRNRLFKLIDATQNLDWLLLTKRPENLGRMIPGCQLKLDSALKASPGTPEANIWYRDNLWLGTSAGTQKSADDKVAKLVEYGNRHSPVLFVSCEPLLEQVTLFEDREGLLRGPAVIESSSVCLGTPYDPTEYIDDSCPGIDWVICGGESGPKARPMDVAWARSLRDQCAMAKVPFFTKQMGGDRKPFAEIPDDLNIRQYPEGF